MNLGTRPQLALVAPVLATDMGVMRKVRAQAEAFGRAGLDCDLVIVPMRTDLMANVISCLPYGRDRVGWDGIDVAAYDAFYLRRTICTTRDFLHFLDRARRGRANVPIVYEIPTYPYDQELRRPLHYLPALAKDRWNRRRLVGRVDRIADLSGHDAIFGVETIQIVNGIDLAATTARSPQLEPETVNVASASSFGSWHGIDRIIEGLSDYYERGGDRDVIVHLMGDGPELERMRRLAGRRGVGARCVFHGRCDRRRMDEVYDRCDIAVASLGLHRIGISLASTLKTREYLAKGLPFVYSGEIDVLRADPADFCLAVPADDGPLDIARLVSFRDGLYARESPRALTRRIRAYAEAHVGMDATMRPVIDYLKEALQA